jgi:hypothetical protein
MQTIEEILEQARSLSADERRRLVDALEQELENEDADSEAKRLAALDRWIARGGTGHSDHASVARNKYEHLAEVYADKK